MAQGSAGRPRILVVGTVDAVQTARLIIGDAFEYRSAFSLGEAQAGLDSEVALVVCSMRFDDARMIDFLERVRANAQGAQLPVVCFHPYSREVSRSAHAAMAAELQRYASARFVDLYATARAHGVSAAAAELREAALAALGYEIAPSADGEAACVA
jgi:hypothetical protein